jgi:quercetin dioxygenase-like cupin family protein
VAQTGHAEVEKHGFTSKVIREDVVAGHLKALNGHYKLRLSETVYEPGGAIGEHNHSGPGYRYIESGELTYTTAGHSTVYKAGDCFYESGMNIHSGRNAGKGLVRLLSFEVLPADWQGASTIPVPDSLRH